MIVQKNGNTFTVKNVKVAKTFIDRAIGLMFKRKMKGFSALLIRPCNAIHTCFMRYSLDVLFLDKNFMIVKIIRCLSPWRFTWIYFRSSQVLELPGGVVPDSVKVGDRVEVECIN